MHAIFLPKNNSNSIFETFNCISNLKVATGIFYNKKLIKWVKFIYHIHITEKQTYNEKTTSL